MTRPELEQLINDRYQVLPEHPWVSYPQHEVFRHQSNRKWFALVMTIPKEKLGLAGNGSVDIVNLKCDPILGASLQRQPGIFPAYHMSKTEWISAALDGSVPDEQLGLLLDLSFDATAPRVRNKHKG